MFVHNTVYNHLIDENDVANVAPFKKNIGNKTVICRNIMKILYNNRNIHKSLKNLETFEILELQHTFPIAKHIIILYIYRNMFSHAYTVYSKI